MFSDQPRLPYRRPQLVEVVCQLHFPTVLSIGTSDPVEFQEKIRAAYPRYQALADKAQSGRSYLFISQDGRWKITLSNSALSLSTLQYTGWEAFSARLDEILACFIEVYRPAHFERVGLRYINAFSRHALGLEGVPFAELIEPAYLGLLGEPDVHEPMFARAFQEADLALPGGGRLKLHCGPGVIKRGELPNPEVKYVLDLDCYLVGRTELRLCVATINTLHEGAYRVFRGAITEKLHQAMQPLERM